MKSISPTVYESLTPRQRIIATIEAEARGDDEESQRLVKTCPKKNYQMNDAAFSDEMQGLMMRSMAFECDMAEMAMHYLLCMWRNKGDPEGWLANMAILQAAWDEEVTDMGIDPVTMAKAGKPRLPLVNLLLDLAPPTNPEAVQELRQRLAQAQDNRREL
jgi:hypothetical protein